MLLLLILFVVGFCISAEKTRRELLNIFETGVKKIDDGDYQGGINLLEKLGDYRDSLSRINSAKNQIAFENAISLFNNGQLNDARVVFSQLKNAVLLNISDGKDPEWYINEIDRINAEEKQKEDLYNTAQEYFRNEEYLNALLLLEKLVDFEDSNQLLENCKTNVARLMHSTTISAGISSSAGVTSDGRVFFSGEMVLRPSDVEDWTDIVSISTMGSLVIGLKMDGTVITAGSLDDDKYYRIETGNWSDIVAVSSGDLYIIGLREDGSLVAQGYNNFGQMNVDDWHDIIAISTGWRLTAGLDSTGQIHVAGYNAQNILDDINANIDEWSDIVAISAGGGRIGINGERGHVVALKQDGTVVAAGDNGRGQCNVQGWSNIIAVSAGAYHTVGLTSDGTVVTTQTDDTITREIAFWNENQDVVAISAGYGFTLGLKSNGTVLGSGYFYNHIRDTDNWENIAYHPDEWQYIFKNS